ncbi:RICIN domain-containing protein [Chitinophaga sp. 22321]|uniref:RICIN domain-containing protein n=1 Tax=Chitinophaga hostae TaxID=2831022 RepID=A0ABS5J6T0_9BACT|nr:RICIN domain-containing protein [Chitinophaga hostae]MBS0030763.1 RICIN domain-containing protein [Chitinophaga hostae]
MKRTIAICLIAGSILFSCGKPHQLEKINNPRNVSAVVLQTPTATKATPALHVEGRYLKDYCGNNVLLHGVAMTPSPWFNGCASGNCRWNNYDIQGCLSYNFAVMDRLTSTDDGFYLNYIRLHIDPYWTNDPGAPIPENDISRFNYNRLVTYTDQVIIPLINHAKSRGMYVILRPPGVCPGRIAVNDAYHAYLTTVWNFLSQHPALKNAENVMFEIANEPVEILGTNGVWGSTGAPHFEALRNFFQPIVNSIRNNGAQNVCWIPGTGWQSHYQGYPNYPITGGNIGYAVHIYPGYWGGVNNYTAFQAAWDINVKPVANIAPIAITETDWSNGYGTFGQGITGTAQGNGFGANLKYITDQSGNVSWNLLGPEDLINEGDPQGVTAFNNDWEACAAPCKQWFAAYASSNIPSVSCSTGDLQNNTVYEIEYLQDPSKVLELQYGNDTNGGVLHPWGRNGASAQRWKAIATGNGYWRFVSLASTSGRCIDLANGATANGTTIRLWDNYSNDAQAWKITSTGNGYYKITSKLNMAKAWDISGCTLNGSNGLQLYDFLQSSCQYVRFVRIN